MSKSSRSARVNASHTEPSALQPAVLIVDFFERAARAIKQVTLLGWDRFWVDRCTLAASSLAYQTALALVPLLAIGLALLKASGQLDAGSNLVSFLIQQIFPSSSEARAEIVLRLSDFSNNIAAGALGSFGLITSTVVGFLLFLSVESIWNHIWESHRERTYIERFLLFYAGITLLPFFAALSVLRTASLWGGQALSRISLSLLSTTVLLTVANRLIPTVRVEWRPALWGGATAAVMLELAKAGMGYYLSWVTGSYRSIYGALGVLPLFLLSIYVSWMIILWGVEVSRAVQRLPLLKPGPDGNIHEVHSDGSSVTGPLAARLLRDVARGFCSGRMGATLLELERRHNLPEVTVRRVFKRLIERNLAVEQTIGNEEGFMLARSPDQITLDEVLRLFQPPLPPPPADEPGSAGTDPAEPDALDKILRELDEHARAEAHPVTLSSLL